MPRTRPGSRSSSASPAPVGDKATTTGSNASARALWGAPCRSNALKADRATLSSRKQYQRVKYKGSAKITITFASNSAVTRPKATGSPTCSSDVSRKASSPRRSRSDSASWRLAPQRVRNEHRPAHRRCRSRDARWCPITGDWTLLHRHVGASVSCASWSMRGRWLRVRLLAPSLLPKRRHPLTMVTTRWSPRSGESGVTWMARILRSPRIEPRNALKSSLEAVLRRLVGGGLAGRFREGSMRTASRMKRRTQACRAAWSSRHGLSMAGCTGPTP